LAASFLEERVVDEWIVYMAPRLLGADAAPLTALAGLAARGASFAFNITSVARLDTDVRLVLEPRREQGAEPCSREL